MDLVYDVILVTQTFEKHVEVLEEIFKPLAVANLTLNKEKCHFCKSQLRYLGYVVDAKGLKVDPEKVNAIWKFLSFAVRKKSGNFVEL